ncbi:MAG: valyl-tRNA synthetase, partial [Alphaproteobacteria bacterium]
RGASSADNARFEALNTFIKGMTRTAEFKPHAGELSRTDVVAVAEGFEIILPLEGHVDFEAEKERVQKEIVKFEIELAKIEGMLGNENFVKRAPEHVVAEQKASKEAILADLTKLKAVMEAR